MNNHHTVFQKSMIPRTQEERRKQNQNPYMTRNESAILLIIRQFRQAGYDYIRKRGLRKTAGGTMEKSL